MFEIENLYNNQNVSFTQKKKGFRVLEHEEDMSVSPYSAQTAFFCSEMNVKKRQLLCDLSEGNVTIQAGAMQWMLGNVNANNWNQRSWRSYFQSFSWKSIRRIHCETRIYRRWIIDVRANL